MMAHKLGEVADTALSDAALCFRRMANGLKLYREIFPQ